MAAADGERGEAVSREEGMAGAVEEEDGEENILYDLLVNTEWPPETEVQVRVAAAWPGCGGADRPRRRGRGCAPGAGRPAAGGGRRPWGPWGRAAASREARRPARFVPDGRKSGEGSRV